MRYFSGIAKVASVAEEMHPDTSCVDVRLGLNAQDVRLCSIKQPRSA
jgi:hypothetical protein